MPWDSLFHISGYVAVRCRLCRCFPRCLHRNLRDRDIPPALVPVDAGLGENDRFCRMSGRLCVEGLVIDIEFVIQADDFVNASYQ